MPEYQTVTLNQDPGEPDATLNAMSVDGWRVHTVLASDDGVFRALMERGSANRAMTQPAKPAPKMPGR